MNWHCEEIKTIENHLMTNIKKGLSEQEAVHRVALRGKNLISDGEKKPGLISRFIEQFKDFMVIILMCAAGVSAFASHAKGENDYIEPIIILAIIVFNALLGVIQEEKAEKALEALKKLSAPKARVLRGGEPKEIPAEDVAQGDILILEAGDMIPADGRLFEAAGLKTEEAALTGESLPSEKSPATLSKVKTPTGDRKNMVFASTFVSSGRGRAMVTATGMETEVGKIAGLLHGAPEDTQTPLQKRLGKTGRILSGVILLFCGIIFLMGLVRQREPFEMFMTAVSLSVAAIPEGLPAIVTIVLAIGTQRMSRKNSIIRKLPAVETLGSAQVICSDKTGTLTQNKMRVVRVSDHIVNLTDSPAKKREILRLMTLCNNSVPNGRHFTGDPLETALSEAAAELGEFKNTLDGKNPRTGEIPFSSERKLMTTIHRTPEGKYISITKGAPEVLIKRCVLCREKGAEEFTAAKKKRALDINSAMAEKALRVIGVAYKEFDREPAAKENICETNLIFAGFAGLFDPPRPEAKKAVDMCREAGIIPVMITGDHVKTAEAVALQLGIYSPGNKIMTGEELDRLSQTRLEAIIEDYRVFARVSPEHKVRIVKAFQSRNLVVAMTGDGVNDAPALKTADIGCAMGITGTDVAKSAADMILTDDNFATIVEAVREGRGIYENIRKSVHFLLSSNIGEVLTIFAAMVFGWATPLLPIQLLWVNLVTDSLPAIALGLDPMDGDIMKARPRSRDKSLFADGAGARIAMEGAMIGLLALIAFGVGHIYYDGGIGYTTGRTMAFGVLSISQLVHAFNMRTEHSIFSINLINNRSLNIAFIVGLLMQISVISVPFLAGIFRVAPLTLGEWFWVILLSLAPVFVVEMEKFFKN